MRRVGRLTRGHSLVVVVSDFREGSDWPRALGALSQRHEVLAVEVVDPREGELPDAGHLTLVDPETGQRFEADTSSAELRRRFAGGRARRAATSSSRTCAAPARGTSS